MTLLAYIVFVSALVGLILGSFTNALVYRLPRGESLMTRSHCTTCFHQIEWYENVPVLSWLMLRGRCSRCGEYISMRYPLVELSMSAAFALLALTAAMLGPGYFFTLGILLTFAFVGGVIALIDLDTKKIPTGLVYGGFIVVLLFAIGYEVLSDAPSRAAGALLAMAAFFLIYFLMWFWKPGAMGYGDVRLSLLVGFVVGWVSIPTAILAFFLPSVLALLWMLPALLRRQASAKTQIPFGPWIVLGALLAILATDIAFADYTHTIGG